MDHINWTEFLPMGQAIGWTIINSLWQIALIAICLRLLLWIIPQNRSDLRYGLALSALIITLIWAGTTFDQQWSISQYNTLESTTMVSPTTESIASNTPSTTPTLEAKGNHSTSKNTPLTTWLDTDSFYKELSLISQNIVPFIPYLAIVWYLGVLVLSIFIIGGFFHLNQLKTVGVHPPSADWQNRFTQLKRQMGITKEVQFLLSEKISSPITFYFFKPIVLAPLSLFSGLSSDQIEVLLLHELAHIRRFDFSINIFQSLIEILFFYHPAVWWMSRELRKEREHCCDDLVMSIHNNPLLYAEALTCIQSSNFSLKTNLAMAATGKKGSFSQRIFRLFGKYDPQPISLRGTFLLLTLLLTGFVMQGFYLPKETKKTIIDNRAITNIPTTATETETLPNIFTEEAVSSETVLVPTRNLEKFDIPALEKTPLAPLSSTLLKWDLPNLRKLVSNKITEPPTIVYSREADAPNDLVEPMAAPTYPLKKTDKVYIDWSKPENKDHISAKTFKKWSPDRIRKLYERNARAQELQDKNKLVTEGSFQGHEEFDPLTYTIVSGATTIDVSLQTYVNHQRHIVDGLKGFVSRQRAQKGLKAAKDLEKNIPFSGSLSPVKGQLPEVVKGTMVYQSERTKKQELGVGLTLNGAVDNVTIEILTQAGDLVETLVNSPLDEGEHGFTWYFKDLSSGTYQIDITVNGETMSQLRTIKTKNKKSKKKRLSNNTADDNCQALLRAVKKNNLEQVKSLVQNTDPNCSYRGDGEPRSPLVAAARKGYLDIGLVLLDAGAKTDYHARGDENPLMAAAKYGHLDFVKVLIQKGAKVNQQISGDGTPLICAVRNNHYEVSEFLLENGADPLQSSPGDESPVHHAIENSNNKMLDLLMKYRSK